MPTILYTYLLLLYPIVYYSESFLLGISADFLLFILLSVHVLLILIFNKKFHFNILDLLFLLYVAWSIGIILYHSTFNRTQSIYIFNCLLFYLYIRNIRNSNNLLLFFVIGGVVQTLWAVLQQLHIINSHHYLFPVTGSFENPAVLSIFLVISLLAGGILYSKAQSPLVKLLWYTSMLFLLYGVIITCSRAAWVALIIGSLYLILQKRNNILRHYHFAYVWTIIAIGVVLILTSLYFINPQSVQGRFLVWHIISDAIIKHPWGYGSLQSHYMLMQAEWFQSHPESIFALLAGNNYHAFNELLRITFETGIIGTCLFVIWISISIISVRQSTENRPKYLVFLLAILSFGMFSYPLSVQSITYIGIATMALIASKCNYFKHAVNVRLNYKSKFFGIISLLLLSIFTITEYCLFKNADNLLRKAQMNANLLKGTDANHYYKKLKNCPDFILCYGKTLYNSGDYPAALNALEQAVRLSPTSEMLCDMGVCYQQEKRYQEAIHAFTTAANMTPAYITPHYQLFTLYQETNNKEKAIEKARHLLSMPVKVINSSVLRYRHQARLFLETID